MPWIGIAMGMVALISGFVVNGLEIKGKFGLLIKMGLLALLTFLICTVGINTTAFWILYSKMKTDYLSYLISRLFVQGQIFNSLFNYALLFIIVPTLNRIKPLKIRLS